MHTDQSVIRLVFGTRMHWVFQVEIHLLSAGTQKHTLGTQKALNPTAQLTTLGGAEPSKARRQQWRAEVS